jgi:hypothetical protein
MLAAAALTPLRGAGSTAAALAAAVADKAVASNPAVVREQAQHANALRALCADAAARSQAAGLNLAAPGFMQRLFGSAKVKQRYFPQCGGCSSVR